MSNSDGLISREALQHLAYTAAVLDTDNGIGYFIDNRIVVDLEDINNMPAAITNAVYEALCLITDQEFEHTDGIWVQTPKGNKIYFKKQVPEGEWKEDAFSIICPFCDMPIEDEVRWLYPDNFDLNFCPNCGKKLRWKGEEK